MVIYCIYSPIIGIGKQTSCTDHYLVWSLCAEGVQLNRQIFLANIPNIMSICS